MVIVAIVVVMAAGGNLFSSTALGSTASAADSVALDPSAFATGACAAFDPTSGDNHETVFLDAGHGGIDPGGIGTTESGATIDEATLNLGIELDATAILRADGFRVVDSRTADTTVVRLTPADTDEGVLSLTGSHDDVVARDECADLGKADALVGIYMDAGATASNAGSVTVYDADRPFAAANQQLATLVQNDVLAAMNAQGWQIPNDGVLPDTGFGSAVGDPSEGGLAALAANYDHLLLIGPPLAGYLDTPSTMPGAVIEPLYLTDPFEGSIAASAADQETIAKGLATAVEQYLTPAKPKSTTG
jgi:N-acetylmuramoyl-L-alanine amidase